MFVNNNKKFLHSISKSLFNKSVNSPGDINKESLRTLSLYEDPEQRVRGGHSFAEVVVVVDGQQVSVNVSVSDHHLHVGDAVEVHDQLKELLEFAGLGSVHREPAELRTILRQEQRGRQNPLHHAAQLTLMQKGVENTTHELLM